MKTEFSERQRHLNLGCGHFPRDGWINADLSLATSAEMICDLDRFPYPFRDAQFDALHASHVLEHLADPFAAVREWHRILRPGGTLHIKVPHFSRGFTNPDHKRGFDVSFPLYFDPEMSPWYTGTPLVFRKLRLRWNAQPYLKRYVAGPVVGTLATVLGTVIDTVANLSPMVFSRLFSFWVGGFEEIEYYFVKPAE